MPESIRLLLVLHNHQPVGNFDHVYEQAYQESYAPFLDIFERYQSLRIALHTSGPLMEWLDEHHSDYVERLASLVASGRIEIVGGAFYEPILTMIPSRDRVGQIRSYTRWLEDRLGAKIHGMWTPERVWEQSLARDMAAAGIRYTVLDDFHFKKTGLRQEDLYGYYVTEDDGHLISVLPGSERLRYLIPFASPQETIDYLGEINRQHPGAVVVFGDDGEKFGTWPDTFKHVYEDGWLMRFFDLLVANQHWLHVTTPAEMLASVPPLGKIYVPECSYREMTEWALPVDRLLEYEEVRQELQEDELGERALPFLQGGFWRNFKVKYPETDAMYARMMMVSRRLAAAEDAGQSGELIDWARRELYRGQCNCAYWHGAFGGVYLPHLRNAVYNHLIAADNLLDEATGNSGPRVEATVEDFNLDAHQEIRLRGDKLVALISPAIGGQLYELDVRSICHNLLATLARRPEAYHRKVVSGAKKQGGAAASIHDRVVFKQPGLEQRLGYDEYLRHSLVDHFYDNDTSLQDIAGGQARERGDFVHGAYEAKVRRNPDRIQVQLARSGNAWGIPLRITKGVTLAAGSGTLAIAYYIEGLPQGRPLHFAVEMNFAGLPAGQADRYFLDGDGQQLGDLGTQLDLQDIAQVGLVDQWLGIELALSTSRPTRLWTYPVETVSQSEGGFELVHQSVAVVPHWLVEPDADGRWSVTMSLAVDTVVAESRMDKTAAATV